MATIASVITRKGDSILLATCSLRSFTNTAINCLRRVLDEHGEDEYLKRWRGRPFPKQELQDLLGLRRERFSKRP